MTTDSSTTAGKLWRHFQRMLINLPPLPDEIDWLLPMKTEPETVRVFEAFLSKFYDDHQPRTLLLGINPGRFGSGITNIAFTDPALLEQECGIENSFPRRGELSAQFVYKVVHAIGGVGDFYEKFFLNSVVPWGFVKGGKNYNYYDERDLQNAMQPLAVRHIQGLLDAGLNREVCLCLGEGKNYRFLQKLNEREGFFKKVIPLPHPRFIMQYRRKRVEEFVGRYVTVLEEARGEE